MIWSMWLLGIIATAAEGPTRAECGAIGYIGRPAVDAWFTAPNTDPWPGVKPQTQCLSPKLLAQ